MSKSGEFTLGVSINKPHQLQAGELDWWLGVHTTYIQTQDYQCWKIIELGDEEIPSSITERKDWLSEHYVKMEKNAKAR